MRGAAPLSDAPDIIERGQYAALVNRLKGGTPLSESQMEQVRSYQAKTAAATAAAAAPTGKKGRKPRPILPALTAASSARDAQSHVVREARDRLAKGKTLANHHARALRDAWLMEESLHLWPSLAAAAADCKVSTSTLRSFGEQGCPGIEPHSPIPKAPVLLWLLENAHGRGGDRGATKDSLEQVELQWRQAKLAKMNDALSAEAEDRARQGVLTVMGAVRHHLRHSLPGALFDVVAAAKDDRSAAELAIADLIENELRRLEPVRIAAPAPAAPEAP